MTSACWRARARCACACAATAITSWPAACRCRRPSCSLRRPMRPSRSAPCSGRSGRNRVRRSKPSSMIAVICSTKPAILTPRRGLSLPLRRRPLDRRANLRPRPHPLHSRRPRMLRPQERSRQHLHPLQTRRPKSNIARGKRCPRFRSRHVRMKIQLERACHGLVRHRALVNVHCARQTRVIVCRAR